MIKELKYDLTKEDFNNWLKDFFKSKHGKKIRLTITLNTSIIVTLINFALDIITNKPLELKLYIMSFLITSVLLYLFYPFFSKLETKINSKGIDYSNNTITINSDNNYIKMDDNNSHEERKWSNIKYIYNLEYSILLFYSDYKAIIIPKRIFESEQEMNEVWNLIQACYNKNRDSETSSE